MLLLFLPPVQTWAAHKVGDYLSEKLKTKVYVESVNIHLPASLAINGILIQDLHQDTLLYTRLAEAKLLGYDGDANKISINELLLQQPIIKLIKPKTDSSFNYQFLIDAFRSDDKNTSDSTRSITWLNNIRIVNGRFTYRNDHKTSTAKGINYNNLVLSNLNTRIQDLKIENDSIWCSIKQLSTKEQSGLELLSFSGDAFICDKSTIINNLVIITPHSNIKTNLSFYYNNYNDFSDFVTNVSLQAKLEKAQVEMSDIAYFSDELYGIEKLTYVSGEVKGKINNLKCKNIDLVFGRNFRLAGNITLSGLPTIEETYIQADIKKLTATRYDLESIPLPPFEKKEHIVLPEKMSLLGLITFKGNISGFFNDIVAYGKFNTSLGVVHSDLSLQKENDKKGFKFNGNVRSTDFNIGKYLGLESSLGKVTLNSKVQGSGLNTPEIKANMDGIIQSIDYNGYRYKNASVKGNLAKNIFTGYLNINEENINLDFSGIIDFSQKIPVYDFSSSIINANLFALGFDKQNKSSVLSANIKMNLSGNKPDNMIGDILINNIRYIKDFDRYQLKEILLTSNEANKNKIIALKSDWVDADMQGQFKIENLKSSFTQIASYFVPALDYTRPIKYINEQYNLNVLIKNGAPLCKLFTPGIIISNGTQVTGTINTQSNAVELKIKSDSIKFNQQTISNIAVSGLTINDALQLTVNVAKLSFNDSLFVRNIKSTFNIADKNNKIAWDLGWQNELRKTTYGDISGIIKIFSPAKADLVFERSIFNVNDSTWVIAQNSTIAVDSSSLSFSDFKVAGNNQELEVTGKIKNTADELIIRLKNFDLQNINPFISSTKLVLKGHADGTFSVRGLNNNALYSSKLHFSKLYINAEKVGDGDLSATWDPKEQSVAMNGSFTLGIVPNVYFDGYYFPKLTENSLRMNVGITTVRLQLFEPWLKGYCSDLKGQVSAQINLSGTPQKPIMVGKAQVAVKKVTIDYLNTSYSLATDDVSEIILEPNSIGFENLTIYDQVGNVAMARGKLFHDNFKNFQLDFDIETQKFLCFNTTAALNPDYYGKAYVAGTINFFGFIDNILVSASIKTLKGTEFYIPLEGPEEIGDNNFITFVKKDEIKNNKANDYKVKVKGLSLDFKVNATPDAEVQLIFDDKVGDVIKSRGYGNMEMKINTAGRFTLTGDYVVESGDYLFTLKNIINKKFDLEKGGTIKWVGDPLNADINLKAVYRQKASLKPFFPYDSTDTYKRRYLVETRLLMTGNLMQPEINFDIDLPTLSDNVKQQVKSYINTDQELNRQVFSLLVLKSFVQPPQFNAEGSSGNAAAANSSELLSNQLSNWLSQISNDFDVGVNYRPGDAISNEELEVALSTQLFNDRMSIDGNVGVNNNAQRQNSSNLIGDVNVDYKLTDDGKLRVKAFNRSNDNNFVLNNGPYTQGVGIFYREEFTTRKELFERYLKKIRRKNNAKSAPNN